MEVTTMKTYKDFPRVHLGDSDIAQLLCRNYQNIQPLKFGGDNSYKAYFVNEEIDLPGHYSHVGTWNTWLWIYDDEGRTAKIQGDVIEIYRAGEMGCIIYAPGGAIEAPWEGHI